jgi:hypothetical protein|tara:strand:- start:1766 stop:1900 length:135 start_codon:yes stop_codon:yes gene_type:complete
MIKNFIKNIKEDPLNFIVDFAALLAIMIFGYGLLLFGAIITGNV